MSNLMLVFIKNPIKRIHNIISPSNKGKILLKITINLLDCWVIFIFSFNLNWLTHNSFEISWQTNYFFFFLDRLIFFLTRQNIKLWLKISLNFRINVHDWLSISYQARFHYKCFLIGVIFTVYIFFITISNFKTILTDNWINLILDFDWNFDFLLTLLYKIKFYFKLTRHFVLFKTINLSSFDNRLLIYLLMTFDFCWRTTQLKFGWCLTLCDEFCLHRW